MTTRSSSRTGSDDFTLTGSRPVSVLGRPRSSAMKSNTYQPIASSSQVDETLFGSHHKQSNDTHFDPPWDDHEKKSSKTKPLLWSPDSSTIKHTNSPGRTETPNRTNTSRTRNKYRLVKHKDTFCDDSLFGAPVEEPDFDAPWNKKERKPKPFVYDATDYRKVKHESLSSVRPPSGRQSITPGRLGMRPNSAAGSRTRPGSATRSSTPMKPVWK